MYNKLWAEKKLREGGATLVSKWVLESDGGEPLIANLESMLSLAGWPNTSSTALVHSMFWFSVYCDRKRALLVDIFFTFYNSRIILL